jgi:hypothetical protein
MKKITNGEKEYVIDKVIIEGGKGLMNEPVYNMIFQLDSVYR